MNANQECKQCNKKLERDEIAIYLRLVSRGAKEYLCIPCLSQYFKCAEEDIHNRITSLKDMGCTLFVTSDLESHTSTVDPSSDLNYYETEREGDCHGD